ncbi:hypothetical protein [Caloranaerobacter ferrireducens]|nr:hypothetical protein [Caloranaerobacter ferrireducens]
MKNQEKIDINLVVHILQKGWVEFTVIILQEAEKIYYIKGDIGTGKSTLY